MYLYGSTARDEADEQSDIDLFADVDYGRFGFVPFMDLHEDLVSGSAARWTSLLAMGFTRIYAIGWLDLQ